MPRGMAQTVLSQPQRQPQLRKRVLLIEHHTLVREALRLLLLKEFDVAARDATLGALPAELRRVQPDVTIVALSTLDREGQAVLRLLRGSRPEARLVVLAEDGSPAVAARGFGVGVVGWILRASSAAELLAAVRAAAIGRRYLTPLVAGGCIGALPSHERRRSPAPGVTPRALEVVRLIAEGKGMKQVAVDLGISTRTVAFHKYKVMRDLGIPSSAGLVRYAVRAGLV